MTRNEFITKLEQNGITLDESRMAEVNYYFNLWGDTMKQDRNYPWSSRMISLPLLRWMKKQ